MYNKNIRYGSDYYLSGNNPVSIVIGSKFEDGIILASDSQASDKEAQTKRLNETKIFEDNKNETKFIYSGAENPTLNKSIFDEMLRCYGDELDFKKQCEEAYNKIKERYPQRLLIIDCQLDC